jgi:hypothetical protein
VDGRGQGEEMAQTMYAHMKMNNKKLNKIKIKNKKRTSVEWVKDHIFIFTDLPSILPLSPIHSQVISKNK